MNALEKFEQKTLELQSDGCMAWKPCWCYGELFAVQTRLDGKQVWQIGCNARDGNPMFPVSRLGLFDKLEDTCEAILELIEAGPWAQKEKLSDEDRALFERIHVKYKTFNEVAPHELLEIINLLKSLDRSLGQGGIA